MGAITWSRRLSAARLRISALLSLPALSSRMERGDGMGLNASAKEVGGRWWGSSRAVESAGSFVEGLDAASRGDLSLNLDGATGGA